MFDCLCNSAHISHFPPIPLSMLPLLLSLIGSKVLDLGCVPGAWLQVACQQLGPKEAGGLVLGLDIQEVSVPKKFCDDRVKVLQQDARLLTPEILTEYTQDVSGGAGGGGGGQ